ncbi:DoxX family protein [Accumulibacter sp.]|uniref:DoxX family protein n=1 Tax=Accumulibacter sp. TaxID=2053492 RepID=UPI0025CEBBF4|nr:DoxX family protein [Accumulibacter sp.]MCM8610546.1 DoxX family protein [Accumulibacter sp.]MCM8634446.1 DoxX family protein [Accumulibacter sp.]MCM8641744.1 DoxX family protein [Accumulibacter sp.]
MTDHADRCLVRKSVELLSRIPDSLIAFLARFALAATFWSSGQTKVQGLRIDIVGGEFEFGWPRLADSLLDLFRDEYRLPLIAPEVAAPMAAVAEHLFPLLLLIGLATRFSALALLGMTAVIQIFVYPDAYALHGTWAAGLLFLVARGGGALSADALLVRRCGGA